MTNITSELIEILKNSSYGWIGIRHLEDDEDYNIGDYCRNSYDWDFEHDCSTYETSEPRELPGTCAINTHIQALWDTPDEIIDKLEKSLKMSNCYYGEAVIIAGNSAEYGNDEGEIIILDAVVICNLSDSLQLAS